MKRKFLKQQKGITLIALVVTIIVLLILAAVALNLVAGESGILSRAEKSSDETIKAIAKEEVELELADYLSEYYQIKYTNNTKVDEENAGDYIKDEGDKDGKTTSGYTYTISETKDANGDYEVQVKDKNSKLLATGKLTSKAKLYWENSSLNISENDKKDDDDNKDLNQGTKVSELQIGDYVDYEVTYTDVYSNYEFTSADGWRVLNPNARDNDGNAVVDIISTGIPARLYYNCNNIKNAEWANSVTIDRSAYISKFNLSNLSDGGNVYGAAGMYYNFANIPFTVIFNPTENGGYTLVNNKTGTQNGSELFIKGKANAVHNITLKELNTARNFPVQNDTTSTATTDAGIGLFNLRALNKFNYNSDSPKADYWFAYPASINGNNMTFVGSDGDISNDPGPRVRGVRPVVSIPVENFNLNKVNPE